MTSKIVADFVSRVDNTKNDYKLDDLKKLLAEAFKANSKKKTGEKKEPTKYNLFIRDEIQRMKKENPSVDNKQLMSLAAAKWREYKEKNGM